MYEYMYIYSVSNTATDIGACYVNQMKVLPGIFDVRVHAIGTAVHSPVAADVRSHSLVVADATANEPVAADVTAHAPVARGVGAAWRRAG